MDPLSRLEEIEAETVDVIENVAELMKMIGLKLKQHKNQDEIISCLKFILDKIADIGEDVQEIIEGLPEKTN
jgi:hypothetical protein